MIQLQSKINKADIKNISWILLSLQLTAILIAKPFSSSLTPRISNNQTPEHTNHDEIA